MTNHLIIRKGVRALCVGLLAAAVCTAWSFAAQAKDNHQQVGNAQIHQTVNSKAVTLTHEDTHASKDKATGGGVMGFLVRPPILGL